MNHILVSLSHPDDESFIFGGTIAQYAKLGWRITAVFATHGPGREGENPEYFQLREKETKKAAHILGIGNVEFLDFADGSLSALNPGEYEDILHRIMARVLPDIVMTFDTNGFSNNPDCIKTSFATTYAFQKYAAHLDELSSMEAPTGRSRVWKEHDLVRSFSDVKVNPEPRLYYACVPESLAAYMKKVGAYPSHVYGKPWNGVDDSTITTVIDIAGLRDIKKSALLCHESQEVDVRSFIDPDSANPFLMKEYYRLRMQGIYEIFMGKTDSVSDSL